MCGFGSGIEGEVAVATAVRLVLKAVFCLILSWMLVLLTLGYVVHYLQISFPVGLFAIPVAIGMFALFSRIEQRSAK